MTKGGQMPYDMLIRETDEHFQANISGMNMLREVMDGAGVDFHTRSTRTRDHRSGRFMRPSRPPGWGEEEGTLMRCFITMEGFLVRAEECREIARKLSEHTETSYIAHGEIVTPLTEWDMEYIQRFSKYCETAAGAGGFYVH